MASLHPLAGKQAAASLPNFMQGIKREASSDHANPPARTPAAADAPQGAAPPAKTPWRTPPPVFAQGPTTPATAIAASGWQAMYSEEEPPAGSIHPILPMTCSEQSRARPFEIPFNMDCIFAAALSF